MPDLRNMPRWLNLLARYGLAVALVGVAQASVTLLEPLFGTQISPPFFLAVMFASLYGGLGPGLVATALAGISMAFFLMGSPEQFLPGVSHLSRLAMFFVVALVTSSVSARRKRAEEGLAGALRQLEAAHRAKDRFIATLSHELRTPLSAIRGWVQLLRTSPDDPTLAAQGLEQIEGSVRDQSRLIEDLLDVSRIILGKLHVEMEPLDMKEAIRDTADMIRPQASELGISLVVRTGDERDRFISGDPTRVRQVLWNLLTNAVKFTPTGGEVRIEIDDFDEQIAVRVSDTGPGIPPQNLPHIFDPLHQAEGSASRGGLGLGLAIVRSLVEAHGGRVEAASEGPGCGASFLLLFPELAKAERLTPIEPNPTPQPSHAPLELR